MINDQYSSEVSKLRKNEELSQIGRNQDMYQLNAMWNSASDLENDKRY